MLAVAEVASDRCADILVDTARLDALREHLHVGETDAAAVAAEGRIVAENLLAGIAVAPSLVAWCDEACRGYGPDGDILPRLMKR